MKRPTRRDFLAALALGAGAAFAPSSLRSAPTSASRPLGVALVGLGSYSTGILGPALLKTRHCRLAGIVTGTPAKISKWRETHRLPEANVYDYANFDRIADNPDIDVVYIVLPNSMHAEFTLRAARAGKHVFCEKPMAVTSAECRAMIAECRRHNRVLTVGYRLQHEPNTVALKQIARDRVFGPARQIEVAAGYRHNLPGHWKLHRNMGGGATLDMGVYSIQGARHATGEEPVAVTARHRTLRPEIFAEVDEGMEFELEFPSGAIARCATSLGENLNHLHADYEHGWVKFKPFSTYSGPRGSASDGRVFGPTIESQQAAQMDADARAILEGTPPVVPGEEGLRDLLIVEAIFESAHTGRRVEIASL